MNCAILPRFNSVQSLSCVWIFAVPWTAAWQASLSITNSQFSSAAQSCPTLCNPMDCSMSGLPVHHQLPEFTQTHVHWVSDAIQPSHPLSSPSLPIFNLSQHQGLFRWVSSSHQVAKVLEFQFQHQSFQRIFSSDFLYDWLVGSRYSPKDSQESSPTPQFQNINSSVLSFLYRINQDYINFNVWIQMTEVNLLSRELNYSVVI